MDVSDNEQPIVYCLRRDNSIDWVNEAWTEAAVQLKITELLPKQIVNQPLDRFIADAQTLRHVTHLIDIARDRGEAQLCYRCDTPTHLRVFNTIVSTSSHGAVELLHEPMIETPLEQTYLLQHGGLMGRKILRCSFCAKLHIDGRWIEPETALDEELLNNPHHIQLAHTTCRGCLSESIG